MNEIYDEKTDGKRVDFNLICQGNLSDEEMISKVIAKHPNLKQMEITLGGRKYKVSPVEEELTLEDCVRDNRWYNNMRGIAVQVVSGSEIRNQYPTEAIAEKVLLYGLLQSVAHKLNEGKDGCGRFVIAYSDKIIVAQCGTTTTWTDPLFKTREIAEQAIRIFANSKFDLKKLYQ